MHWSPADLTYLVGVPGCMADGPTQTEAIANARIIIQEWLNFSKELGNPIPASSERLNLAA